VCGCTVLIEICARALECSSALVLSLLVIHTQMCTGRLQHCNGQQAVKIFRSFLPVWHLRLCSLTVAAFLPDSATQVACLALGWLGGWGFGVGRVLTRCGFVRALVCSHGLPGRANSMTLLAGSLQLVVREQGWQLLLQLRCRAAVG
jgi:hypothetical protein